MSTTVPADIQRLQDQIARGKSSDRRNRMTDAAAHLRHAMVLLEGCIERTDCTDRVAALLCEAVDVLTAGEP